MPQSWKDAHERSDVLTNSPPKIKNLQVNEICHLQVFYMNAECLKHDDAVMGIFR